MIVSRSSVEVVVPVSIDRYIIPIPAIQRVIARATEKAVTTAEAIDAASSFGAGTAVAGFQNIVGCGAFDGVATAIAANEDVVVLR